MSRGKSKASLALVQACQEILREIQPASVRAVCYRLFTRGLIPNMGRASTNKVSSQLVWAREHGIVPWAWVVDETREAERVNTWANPDEIIDAAVAGYRRDYWQEQPLRIEIWSEKGTVRGTLAPVLRAYGVTFRVMHGYGSATSLKSIAEDSTASDKPLIAFYAGDWDPSGLHMSEVDLPNRIDRYGGRVVIHRIALDEHDVGDQLPSFPASSKTGDPRHKWFVSRYGGRCWELDALSPVVLRDRVKHCIESSLDSKAWQRAVEVEAAEVQSMREFSKSWQASICSGARP